MVLPRLIGRLCSIAVLLLSDCESPIADAVSPRSILEIERFLSYGMPMLAIPIANDQPGVAARIAWTGAGEVITLAKLNSSRLQAAVKKVLCCWAIALMKIRHLH
jgi:UDP-glucoronosyl and UDP-glucosyl transferase